MLTRTLDITFEGFIAASTPLLIPSFSSRAAIPSQLSIEMAIDIMSEIITDVSLISAYDVYHSKGRFPKLEAQNLLFIDSGGYECIADNNLTDIGFYKPPSNEWDAQKHVETIDAFSTPIPLVLISYDHPHQRCSIDEQIHSASDLFAGRDVLKEILLKSSSRSPIDVGQVSQNIESLREFDVLGMTEKELGATVLTRMKSIAHLRLEMEKVGLQIPIHIFGSLDPITSPLYYLSGADIFDGLSWLRYSFGDGELHYINCKGIVSKGIEVEQRMMWVEICQENYYALKELENKLRLVHDTQDLNALGYQRDFFTSAYEKLNNELGGVL